MIKLNRLFHYIFRRTTMKTISMLLILLGLSIYGASDTLTADKLQELSHLSSTYKQEYVSLKTSVTQLDTKYETLYKEQLELTQSLLETNQKLEEKITKDKQEKIYYWLGIGGAALLGMIAN